MKTLISFILIFCLSLVIYAAPPWVWMTQPVASSSGPPASIVGRWTMNEGSGTTVGDSVGANNGTLSGATWTTGKAGSGLNYSGASDQVLLSPYNYTDNWTYAFWVARNTSGRLDAIIGQWTSSGSGRNLYIYFTTSPDNHLQVDIPFIAAIGSSTATITDTAWHHIAVTRSGSTWKIYIDGVLDNTITDSNVQESTATDMRFGRSVAATTVLQGKLDDVVICNTALSLAEIQYLYNNPL